jgi:hypothetical protein
MRRKDIVIIFCSAILLFCLGCAQERVMDKGKFAELNRAAHDLKTFIASDKPCELPDSLLQRLVSGTEALKNKTPAKDESDLLQAYSDLLTIYKDGLLLCKYRNHLSHFQFVPKGRIYVPQELDPIVLKYGLQTERHLYRPTGEYWRSIAGDSIKVIWAGAEFQIKNIENMTNYN